MLPGRPYLVKLGATHASARRSASRSTSSTSTRSITSRRERCISTRSACAISTLDRAVAFDSYADNRDMGGFIVIDRFNNATVGAGMLHFALRRSQNIHWQALEVDKDARARA